MSSPVVMIFTTDVDALMVRMILSVVASKCRENDISIVVIPILIM